MEDRKIYISISSGTIIKTMLWVIFLLLLYYIKDVVLVVLAAIVIASAIEPAAHWFKSHRIGRLPAVILIYLVLALCLAGLFIFFVPSVLGEALTYLNNLPANINLGDLWSPLSNVSFLGGSGVSIPDKTISLAQFLNFSRDAISGTSAGAFKTASLIFGGALSFILMIVLSFYLAVQDDGVGSFLRIVTPIKHHDYIIGLWKRSQKKIGYWMQGQLLLGLIVGVLTYIGLMILGVRHALLLASLAGIFELIPIFGPILSAVPAVLIALVDQGMTYGILVAGLYLIIQQFENHLLYPLVVRKIVGISPMVVILAIVIGGKLAGFLGVLLSVPISAALMEWVDDVEKGKIEAKRIAEV
jgi:predicted PurR-regulated permease PerM